MKPVKGPPHRSWVVSSESVGWRVSMYPTCSSGIARRNPLKRKEDGPETDRHTPHPPSPSPPRPGAVPREKISGLKRPLPIFALCGLQYLEEYLDVYVLHLVDQTPRRPSLLHYCMRYLHSRAAPPFFIPFSGFAGGDDGGRCGMPLAGFRRVASTYRTSNGPRSTLGGYLGPLRLCQRSPPFLLA
jgi:hypothetical protein